jgi:hypothetical protein
MAAAAAAVGAFIVVYIVGFLQAGALPTFLFGWIPAAALAWLAAHLTKSAMQVAFDLAQSRGAFAFGGTDDELRPVALRPVRRRDRRH